jgi:hypothetical protein
MASPMLTCEEAYLLAQFARAVDPKAILAVGPIPRRGEDKSFPPGAPPEKAYRVYAEKAPNARGVRRVLEALSTGEKVLSYTELLAQARSPRPGSAAVAGLIITGNYPDAWADDDLMSIVNRARPEGRRFVVLIDTLTSRLVDDADVVLPGATFAEKAGTFENARGDLQAFDEAIPVLEMAKTEGQVALELLRAAAASGIDVPVRAFHTGDAVYVARAHGADQRGTGSIPGIAGDPAAGGEGDDAEGGPISDDLVQVLHARFNASDVRRWMAAAYPALGVFSTGVKLPERIDAARSDMQVVEL